MTTLCARVTDPTMAPLGGNGADSFGRARIQMADRRGSRWIAVGATALACGALVLGGAGVGTAVAAPNAIKNVTIANYLFTPFKIKLKAGGKVVWTNNDSTSHNVEFSTFGSKTLVTGATYGHRFLTAGTFSYHCSFHPDMTGKVVVVAP